MPEEQVRRREPKHGHDRDHGRHAEQRSRDILEREQLPAYVMDAGPADSEGRDYCRKRGEGEHQRVDAAAVRAGHAGDENGRANDGHQLEELDDYRQ